MLIKLNFFYVFIVCKVFTIIFFLRQTSIFWYSLPVCIYHLFLPHTQWLGSADLRVTLYVLMKSYELMTVGIVRDLRHFFRGRSKKNSAQTFTVVIEIGNLRCMKQEVEVFMGRTFRIVLGHAPKCTFKCVTGTRPKPEFLLF